MLYACTNCNNCVQSCKFPFSEDIVNMIDAAREDMVAEGLVMPRVARFFQNIEAYGNPYRELRESRGRWADGTGVEPYNGQEYLFYVGCVGSFDERGQRAARALGELLVKAGVSFGILGPAEECDGNEVRLMGESRIFELLREQNTSLFRQKGVKKIIALSPHSLNVFRNEYPEGLEVWHYTSVLGELIEKGKLKPSTKLSLKVTYHDPCFLGRHAGEYEAPRDILKAIPGLKLVEMERNRENAFCCGGGSGNFYTDFFGGGENSPARIRVREAAETGAEVIAVACPACAVMLGEAVKDEGLAEKMAVKDVAEILRDSVLA
jgi:Fe-S oxidoreductase